MEFKLIVNFSCSVPDNYKIIKDFYETVILDSEPEYENILSILKTSFDVINVSIDHLTLTPDKTACFVKLGGDDTVLQINIRYRPALYINDTYYKLEEFEF